MIRLLGFGRGAKAEAILAAFSRSQAIIEFALDSTVITANENFLALTGYTLDEIKGQKHAMFVEPAERASAAYLAFWDALRSGQFERAQFKRLGKNGKEIWIEASYNPVPDRRGRICKIINLASDVTEQKRLLADLQGKVDAIDRSQATIEFQLDGTILTANKNFLGAMGYTLAEIQGRKHSMFVEAAYRDSQDYRAFWQKLNRGEYQAAQFKRIGKNGKPVWIEASYNPVFDLDGRLWKILKHATDITERVTSLATLKSTMDTRFDEIGQALATSDREAERAATVVQTSSTGVQGMAENVEQLAASVREIANSMALSRTATDSAHGQIRAADEATRRLAETSASMGGIIEIIRKITGQINLLALNATIESARAGDAGKGFAVVANEVKSLAQQSRGATDLISAEIEKLQAVSSEVVASLYRIGEAVSEVRNYVVGAASAVEEQSAVTEVISSGMQEMAHDVSAINDNMSAIGAAVQQVSSAVDSTRRAARVLVQ